MYIPCPSWTSCTHFKSYAMVRQKGHAGKCSGGEPSVHYELISYLYKHTDMYNVA